MKKAIILLAVMTFWVSFFYVSSEENNKSKEETLSRNSNNNTIKKGKRKIPDDIQLISLSIDETLTDTAKKLCRKRYNQKLWMDKNECILTMR